jgi:hypothetical protein
MTGIGGITKNDLYAYLIREGVKRGYEVIPEFVMTLNSRKSRRVDLAWVTRKRGHKGRQNQENVAYWNLKALFEIEGSNIRKLPNEFKRHRRAFRFASTEYGKQVRCYVVLYTDAYDRAWKHAKNRRDEIAERIGWSSPDVVVVDGNRIESVIRPWGTTTI